MGKVNIYFFCAVTFCFRKRAVYEIMWKNMVESDKLQETNNMAHAHFVLDNWSFRHIFRICNTQQWLLESAFVYFV